MAEVWADVPRYKGFYEVSDQGRVRSLDRVTRGRNGKPRIVRGRILAYSYKCSGYTTVRLSVEGVPETIRVHLLVARAFLGQCPDGYVTRHKDDDRTNPVLTNLEWGTQIQNLCDA